MLFTPSSFLTSVDKIFEIVPLDRETGKKIERSTVKLSEPRDMFLIKEVFRFYWILSTGYRGSVERPQPRFVRGVPAGSTLIGTPLCSNKTPRNTHIAEICGGYAYETLSGEGSRRVCSPVSAETKAPSKGKGAEPS